MQITKAEVQEWLKENKVTRAYMEFLAKEAFGYRTAAAGGVILSQTDDFAKLGQAYSRIIDRAQLLEQLQDEEQLTEVLANEDQTSGA